MRIGVDTGGTFTDLVGDDGSVVKVGSTPDDPAVAIGEAIARVTAVAPELLAHGTTVATNALLEQKVGRVALVATRGFADVIEIARQSRPSLYDQHVDRSPPLVPRELRFEVSGRLDGAGCELEAFDGRVPVIDEVDAVAVCLLHADLDAVARTCGGAGARGAGTRRRVLARSLTRVPRVRAHGHDRGGRRAAPRLPRVPLRARGRLAREVLVMTSAGGLVPLEDAVTRPAALLLSGPVAGVRAAAVVAEACGFPDAVSFDMGGTSTDVCLVRDGTPEPAPTLTIAGYPIRLPAVAVHTIGAGGGSIARLDNGGALVVGPLSAGAPTRARVLRARRRAGDGDRRRRRVRADPRRLRLCRARPHRCCRRASRRSTAPE